MRLLTLLLLLCVATAAAQTNALYQNLPVGQYAVGFRIVTLIDSSRVDKPEFNYLGEKTEGDRHRKITIHLWYPAVANAAKNKLSFEDYCYNSLRNSTNSAVAAAQKEAKINEKKFSIQRWFGNLDAEVWQRLLQTPMLAYADAAPLKQDFPLLIGMLRPLSTTLTNEMLASNGYVVAMISDGPYPSFSRAALTCIPDMQQAIAYLQKGHSVDVGKLGVFGFSGSGFIPLLFSMFDERVKAVADIESGFYMTGLHNGLSSSDFYTPGKLRSPFLHIFSRDLSKQEEHLNELEKKTAFSKRYRLLLNQPALHHWDFAIEGYVSAAVLNMRGAQGANIKKSFEISSLYLLHFFNAELKKEEAAKKFLAQKPVLPGTADSLWSITTLPAQKPAPDYEAFKLIVEKKGIDEALALARAALPNDSISDLRQGFLLNGLGYQFLREKKYAESIGVFVLNAELHPEDANLFDSLSEGLEAAGKKEEMRKAAQQVLDLLAKKSTLNDGEKSLKEAAQKRTAAQ